MNKIREKYCKDSAGNHNESRWKDFKATENLYEEDLDRLQMNIYNIKEQLEEGVEKDADILTERLFVRQTYYDFVSDRIEKREVAKLKKKEKVKRKAVKKETK